MLDRTKEAHPAEQEPVLFESATNTSDNSTILAGAMTWKNESCQPCEPRDLAMVQ